MRRSGVWGEDGGGRGGDVGGLDAEGGGEEVVGSVADVFDEAEGMTAVDKQDG